MVRFTDDPAEALDRSRDFLASDPHANNLILTLLQARVAAPMPGRYWVVDDGERVVGLVFQSPLDFKAAITAMPFEAVKAAVTAVVEGGVDLPGVTGEAATAAAFAGQWTEARRCGAVPNAGMRLYKLGTLVPPDRIPGRERQAVDADVPLVIEWMAGFGRDTGEGVPSAAVVEGRVGAGQFWLWVDEQPVSMAARSTTAAGIARIQAVYTPPDRRRRGYASAVVAALSRVVRGEGGDCVLYTELANATSNSIYRDIGYQAIAEVTRYDFVSA